jgi:hypothetical protein
LENDDDGKKNKGADMEKRKAAAWSFLMDRTENSTEAAELVRKGVVDELLLHVLHSDEDGDRQYKPFALRVFSRLTLQRDERVKKALPFLTFLKVSLSFVKDFVEDFPSLPTSQQAKAEEEERSSKRAPLLLSSLQCIVHCVQALKAPPSATGDEAVTGADAKHIETFVTDLGGLQVLKNLADGGPFPILTELHDKVSGATAAALNMIFGALPDTVAEKEFQGILKSLVDESNAQANVKKQLSTIAAISAVAHNQASIEMLSKDENACKCLAGLCRSGGPRTQAYIIDVCASMAGNERGRVVLEPFVPVLNWLMEFSTKENIRASAAVTTAKLEAMKKKTGFDPGVESGQIVLAQVLDMLSSPPSEEGSNATALHGVEALTYMLSSTRVKEAVCASPDTLRSIINLDILTDKGRNKKGNKSVGVYGLCCLWRDLTMSNLAKKKDKLREMEVTEKQWKEFEKVTKMGGGSNEEENDTDEMVAARVEQVVAAGGVTAIINLANHLEANATADDKKKAGAAAAAPSTALAQAFCNISMSVSARGKLVAGGGVKAMIALADEVPGLAGQALSRTLITTNPSLLPHSTASNCVAPLMWCISESKDNLKEFEALMGLTNLLSLGDETISDRVAKSLHCIEYAQFSSHLMVRRAATEAMCNMVYHEKLVKHLCSNDGEKLRLWLAFAQDEANDFETARAAAGGLAMMVSHPELAKLVLKEKGLLIMAKVLKDSTHDDMRIRAIHCIKTLREFQQSGEQ